MRGTYFPRGLFAGRVVPVGENVVVHDTEITEMTVQTVAPGNSSSNSTLLPQGGACEYGIAPRRSIDGPVVCASPKMTYAAVAAAAPARRPPPPRIIGRPKANLPVSQLTLGRTSPPWYASSWSTDSAEIVGDPDLGDLLRVHYPRGSGTPSSRGPPGGASFRATPRCLPATDVTLEYRVRFHSTFDWGYGGKLPGLSIGEGPSSGGEHSSRAASCRLMWQPGGRVIAYVYTPAGVRQSREYSLEAGPRGGGVYGDGLFRSAELQLRGRGRRNTIVIRVKLNGFDESGRPVRDGVLTVSVNGKAATMCGIVWRRYPDVKVTHVFFSTFYGGKWTSPVTTHADFDGFSVVT